MSSALRAPRRARQGLAALMLGAALALVACSAKNPERPAPLVKKLVQRVPVHTLWRTRLRRDAPKLRVGLIAAVDGQRVFIASHNGRVEALDLASGRHLWRIRVRATLSGGPGAGAGVVVVGGAKGNVIALSETDGKVRWQRRINSEILSAPAVGTDFVVVRGVDGRLQALTTATGADTWIAMQTVPRLSLRGTGIPILDGDLAICGFDDGHVLAVDRSNGMVAWSAAVGQPHGTSELQRLIDLDAPVVPAGDDLFAVAYQGRVARLDRNSGRIAWTHDFSSYRGLALDASALYVAGADGTLIRLSRQNGAVQWQQRILANRELSTPVIYHGELVVGDRDGFLHWFDPASGRYLARVRVGKSRISAAPVVAGDELLVFNDDGTLAALRTPDAPVVLPAQTASGAATR
ncbi:MAG TPA: outer membrane protein assembly factor BamB [Steroidobacteraceae bacterium]|nr:outer membrane protein assembly factor BamB [Steroidobacteraceae bacterium]